MLHSKVMSKVRSFLEGRVTLQSLPEFSVPQPAMPMLKRLCLPQGRLDQVYHGDEGIRYLAVVEYMPGNNRGNHVHERKSEFSYLISGKVRLVLEDPSTRKRECLQMVPGDLAFIQAGIAHVVQPLDAGLGLEYSTTPFDPEDTRRVDLV